jgi:hypothetical protein
MAPYNNPQKTRKKQSFQISGLIIPGLQHSKLPLSVAGGCLKWTSLWMREPNCSVAESGVSSGSPSDLGHSEEECEKTRVSHRHSLPHVQHGGGSSRWVSLCAPHQLLVNSRTRRGYRNCPGVLAHHLCTVALSLKLGTSLRRNLVGFQAVKVTLQVKIKTFLWLFN